MKTALYICQFCDYEFKSKSSETHCPVCTHVVMSEEELEAARDGEYSPLGIEFEADFELSPPEVEESMITEYKPEGSREEGEKMMGNYEPTKDNPLIVFDIEDVKRLMSQHPDWTCETVRDVDEKNGDISCSYLIYKE